MAKLREIAIGWIYTVSGVNERSFPLGIKNVNMKELLVIFPSVMVAIAFAFKNIMVSMAALVPALFIIFYEEKSMDEFQYMYYFLKFYLRDLMQPSERKKEEKAKPEEPKQKQAKSLPSVKLPSFSLSSLKKVDVAFIVAGIAMAIAGLPGVLKVYEFVPASPREVLISSVLFAVGTGMAAGFTLVLLLKKRK